MLIPVEPFPGPLELQNHQTLTTVSLTVSLSLTVTHSLWGKGGWDGPESAGCVRSCCDCISLFAFGPSKMTFFFSKGKKKGKDMMWCVAKYGVSYLEFVLFILPIQVHTHSMQCEVNKHTHSQCCGARRASLLKGLTSSPIYTAASNLRP